MCFSATASFVASGGLAVVSAATVQVAPRQRRFLALVPLGFALQQLFEGVRWVTDGAGALCTAADYGFAMIAFVVWPMFIPLTAYLIDRAGRKRIRWFLGLGIAVAIWDLLVLIALPLQVYVYAGRIVYDVGIGSPWIWFVTLLYLIAVCGSLLVSKMRALKIMGALGLCSFTVAYMWSPLGFPSVWCYFAAVLSVMVYVFARIPIRRSAL